MSDHEKERVRQWCAGLREMADAIEAFPELCPFGGVHVGRHFCTAQCFDAVADGAELGLAQVNGEYIHRDSAPFAGGHMFGVQTTVLEYEKTKEPVTTNITG